MVSRCCGQEAYIEGYEHYYYCCMKCSKPCSLTMFKQKSEDQERKSYDDIG